MDDLSGKVAVVTGAASGIGLAMAERFVAEGMRVVMADVEADALQRARTSLLEKGGDVAAFQADVSRPEEVSDLAAFAQGTYGTVQLLCNNAGVGIGGTVWEHSPDDWQWLLGVNVLGVVNGLREFVPAMLEQGDECHIVNTASAAGLDARPWLGMYSATKYAVVAITEALQAELRMRGANIGVSVLCPALVNTRIAESERNRPGDGAANAEGLAPDAQAFDQAFRAALAQGIPPAEVADAVLDAIRTGRFYVITQSDTAARVRDRFNKILADASLTVT
jgi:NAD(P)-dependent dehydrogenase (short-subunit alcohol dehydrogenase family)